MKYDDVFCEICGIDVDKEDERGCRSCGKALCRNCDCDCGGGYATA